MQPTVFALRFVCCLFVTVLATTGCTATPTPSPVREATPTIDLLVNPGSSLSTNSSVAIIANVSPPQELDFLKWTVSGTSGGSVTPSTGGQVVYTAGPNPGVDLVVAEGTSSSGAYIHATTSITVIGGPTPTAVVPLAAEKWPQDPQAAADLFAVGRGEWTQNQYGGWTLKADWPPIEVNIPSGITFEGYNDGPEPPQSFECYTVLGPAQVKVQGGTLWYPDDPSDPSWTAKKVHKERKDENCTVIGFTPD